MRFKKEEAPFDQTKRLGFNMGSWRFCVYVHYPHHIVLLLVLVHTFNMVL